MRNYLVGAIVLVVLAFTSLGSAAASPTSVGTDSSSATSLDTSAASGRCSKATALQVVERLHLGDPGIPDPSHRVAQVLCGAFVGPGSQAMVAAIANGTCWPNSGWAVFRFTGGAWQLVPNGYHGGFVAALAAVGSDIRQTVPVWHKSDGPCNPSGGRKTRIWHWNGSRLVAGPWKVTSTGPKTVSLDDFLSPDRKTWCVIGKGAVGDEAFCATLTPVQSATLRRNGAVAICNGTAGGDCGNGWHSSAPVLRYGQQNERYGYRCTSERTGITCTVLAGAASGKGFLINRQGVSRVGP
jgi:hypothetical protein